MPRTRAQRRATQGLLALGDDPLRCALTFLSVSDCARGPGATSKAMREEVSSKRLMTARTSGAYVLRPPDHGVVHALATAFGTREWPTRAPQHCWGRSLDLSGIRLRVPPTPLRIKVHRVRIEDEPGRQGNAESFKNFNGTLVSRGRLGYYAFPVESPDCSLEPGSFIEYELPFQLRISHFRIAFGSCFACNFGEWNFEAYTDDGWTIMHYCSESPWSGLGFPEGGPEKIFGVNWFGGKVASSRFRIRLRRRQCMHVRAFELFGTILPRSNPDPAPPSPEEASVHTNEVLDDN